MSSYSYLTGRERTIKLTGSFSFSYSFRVDMAGCQIVTDDFGATAHYNWGMDCNGGDDAGAGCEGDVIAAGFGDPLGTVDGDNITVPGHWATILSNLGLRYVASKPVLLGVDGGGHNIWGGDLTIKFYTGYDDMLDVSDIYAYVTPIQTITIPLGGGYPPYLGIGGPKRIASRVNTIAEPYGPADPQDETVASGGSYEVGCDLEELISVDTYNAITVFERPANRKGYIKINGGTIQTGRDIGTHTPYAPSWYTTFITKQTSPASTGGAVTVTGSMEISGETVSFPEPDVPGTNYLRGVYVLPQFDVSVSERNFWSEANEEFSITTTEFATDAPLTGTGHIDYEVRATRSVTMDWEPGDWPDSPFPGVPPATVENTTNNGRGITPVYTDASKAATGGDDFALRGRPFDAWTVSHDTTRYLHDTGGHFPGISVGNGWSKWYGSIPYTLSVLDTPNRLKIVVGDDNHNGFPEGVLLYKTGISHQLEHRFYKVRIRSVDSANKPFTLQFGDFLEGTYEVFPTQTTGADGEWVEREFDRYEIMRKAASDAGQDYWYAPPIVSCGKVAITGLAYNTTYEVEWIRGETKYEYKVGAVSREGSRNLIPLDQIWLWVDALPVIVPRPYPENPTVDWMPNWAIHVSRLAEPPSDYGTQPDGSVLSLDYYENDQCQYLFLDNHADTTGSQTFVAAPRYKVLYCHPAAGDVFGVNDSSRPFGLITPLKFRSIVRGQLAGAVFSSKRVKLIRNSDSASGGTGTGNSYHLYFTGSPYAASILGEDELILTYKATLDVSSPPERLVWNGPSFHNGDRFFAAWWFIPATGRLCIDSARGWLMEGLGRRVDTYSIEKVLAVTHPDPEFNSVNYQHDSTDIDGFMSIEYDPRKSAVALLASAGGLAVLYVSRDSGKTYKEVGTVEAKSAALYMDSERGTIIVIFENGENIKRQVSSDVGDTWDDPVEVKLDGSVNTGTVIDMAGDARRGGVLALAATDSSGTTAVLVSRDMGKTFKTVLS